MATETAALTSMTAQSRRSTAPLMSAMDARRPRLGQLRTAIGGGIDPGYWRPGHGHVARVLRLAHFHERVQVHVVLGEPVKVLEEQFQLLAR